MDLEHSFSSSQDVFPAGDFSSWLREIRRSLLGKGNMDVACGECIGCCSSSYFIHIRPEDREAARGIPKEILFPAPGLPDGHFLMGYDQGGRCPMLKGTRCEIYEERPRTCREYDCRIFAAAGIEAGGEEKTVINQRVKHWVFGYPTEGDREEHLAVRAAATFIREQAGYFPGGRVPDNPSQLAILAIKSYDVFMVSESRDETSFAELASQVVEACRRFDLSREQCG